VHLIAAIFAPRNEEFIGKYAGNQFKIKPPESTRKRLIVGDE